MNTNPEQLKAEWVHAQAACAEMRGLLNWLKNRDISVADKIQIDRALSDDCGKSILKERDQLKARVDELESVLVELQAKACDFLNPNEDGHPECHCCHMELETASKGHRIDCLANAILNARTDATMKGGK